ncbi:hypothetical protein H4O18_20695 [Arenibacter sp. BSSL-BM3]|uniref:DUF4886 domain-containing protein n=1 Tax=Arenibacter arenosicollis TaxID=2762274 RepID=A0ABR7QTD3_9FLAO|nr:hypothetical protein [Arenibacter arenosicollis]MBC8770426.1 hypothetical protein [Arenibacter arenosicollis]
MRSKILILIAIILWSCKSNDLDKSDSQSTSFNIEKDLLLVQYDCKTDVDDLHTLAAFITLISNPNFLKINYYAVAGTYGIQDGLYIPPNALFQLAFGDNWSDAHENRKSAVEQVKVKIIATLENEGAIWIAEAGQSDFTAELLRSIQADLPEINTTQNIHVVQHSDWNEKVTSPEHLQFVKNNADYHKIPDGNVVGNGTPGFRSPDYSNWKDKIKNPELLEIWELAIELSNKYNGKEGRYNNEAISKGGLDFSDLSEVCWILGIQDIKDTEHFFNLYSN